MTASLEKVGRKYFFCCSSFSIFLRKVIDYYYTINQTPTSSRTHNKYMVFCVVNVYHFETENSSFLFFPITLLTFYHGNSFSLWLDHSFFVVRNFSLKCLDWIVEFRPFFIEIQSINTIEYIKYVEMLFDLQKYLKTLNSYTHQCCGG